MDTIRQLLKQGYFELGEAFKDLEDRHVWERPAAGLLSIGELAGHISYWEALKFAGDSRDLDSCVVRSPLIDRRFRYYTASLAEPPTPAQRAMTASEVHAEMVRIHDEAFAHFESRGIDLDAPVDGWWEGANYRQFLQYAVFHIAYHTGQMYTVRHLLGEQTPDN